MVLARKLTPELTHLIKEIDKATAKHDKQFMGSFVIFLSLDPKLPDQLKQMAKKEELKHIILSVDHPAGPEGYKVASKADVTVVLYSDCVVRANHTFAGGGLDAKAVDQILADIPKILPKD